MSKPFKFNEPTEKDIENAIFEYLRYQVGVFAFKVNTMGVFDTKGGFYRRLSKNVLTGTPDIIACYNVNGIGVFIGMEVKSASGRQSKDQKEFQELLQDRSNGFYFIVRSIQDVEQALRTVNERLSRPRSP